MWSERTSLRPQIVSADMCDFTPVFFSKTQDKFALGQAIVVVCCQRESEGNALWFTGHNKRPL